MTPANLHFIKQCLTPCHSCVVVSAVGKEHPNDVKATDLLKQFYLTRDEALWNAFSDKYRRLVEVNGIDADVDKLLFDARERALNCNLDYCMSLGEEMSAKITAIYLNAAYIEAEQIVRFGKRRLQFDATVKSIAAAFNGVKLAVTGGFYGGSVCSRHVFSRGGSDITGSLCAVATGSSLYENWTDSYGVCVANPTKVCDVSTVYSLSYDEMFALSQAGAEVLHPDAVKPCRDFGIPIKIGNFYNPFGASTTVANCPSRAAVLSLAEKVNANGNTVTTVLHSLPKHRLVWIFSEFFKGNYQGERELGKSYFFEKNAVISFTCDDRTATVVTAESVIAPLYKHLKTSGVIR